MEHSIYLDNNSTTEIDDRVLEAMIPFFKTNYANASSRNLFGLTVNELLDEATQKIAQFLGAKSSEMVYTSGATESINLALKGLNIEHKKHIITVKTEHQAVLDTTEYLKNQGYDITYLSTDSNGLLNLEELVNSITDRTQMICVMLVNNETGVIQPIQEISKIAHDAAVLFFCDATQAVGKIPVDVKKMGIDLLAFSAHKFYGPKGIGGLYISSKVGNQIHQQMHGGGHQKNRRSGTLNVPGIIGMAKALEIAKTEMEEDQTRIGKLRDLLEYNLLQIPSVRLNGSLENRIYNTSNLCFPGIHSEQMIIALQNISVSSGSACSSTTSKPSHVLQAMGLSDENALSSIRFSLGRFNTEQDVLTTIDKVKSVVGFLR